MTWDKTKPATSGALNSAEVRDNWAWLESIISVGHDFSTGAHTPSLPAYSPTNGADLPETYPVGISVTLASAGAGGWPSSDKGVVLTIRYAASGDEIKQLFFTSASSGYLWVRHKTVGANTWQAWQKVITGDVSSGQLSVDGVVYGSEWVKAPTTPTYSSATQFTVLGNNATGTYVAGRRVKVVLAGGTYYSEVSSSSYGGGNTTVTLADSLLTNPLTSVFYSIATPGATGSLSARSVCGYPVATTKTANSIPVTDSSSRVVADLLGSADQVDGFHASQTPAASTVVVADTAGNGSKIGGGWLSSHCVRDTSRGLKITCTAVASLSVTAQELVLQDSNGYAYSRTNISETVSITSSGAGGLDTGAEANNTWYYIWIVSKLDGTVDGLLSTSSTSPVLPGGYVMKALVGSVRNDASGNFIGFSQHGYRGHYTSVPLPLIKEGTFTTSNWTAVGVADQFPPTASFVIMHAASNDGYLGVSPHDTGAGGSIYRFTAPTGGLPTFNLIPTGRYAHATVGVPYNATADTNIYYYVTNANSTLAAVGWEY